MTLTLAYFFCLDFTTLDRHVNESYECGKAVVDFDR